MVSPTDPNCPSPEALGELLDSTDNPELSKHVQNCPKCAQVLARYREIDAMTRDVYPPPAGLAARIQEACSREAEKMDAERLMQEFAPRGARWHFWGQALAAAAALLVVAVLSSVVTARHFSEQPQEHAVLADASAVKAELARQSEAPRLAPMLAAKPSPAREVAPRPQLFQTESGGFSLADSRRLQLARPRHEGNVDEVAMVSNEAQRLQGAPSLRKLVLLPNSVEHVWIAKNGRPPVEALQETREAFPEVIQEISEPDELGIVTLRLQMTDQRVQGMVNALQESGAWRLLSPSYPQPGEEAQIAFQDAPVQYTLKLLPAP